MKLEVAKKWIEALRSGKYKKTVGTLKRVDNYEQGSFCALGVLCDIYQREHERPLLEHKISAKAKRSKVAIDGEVDLIPEEVRVWAGMSSPAGHVETKHGELTIPCLNDEGRMSFKKIADIIEENIENI